MQKPKKHHYLPEFFTTPWCDAGELIRYVNRNGTVHTRPFTPGQIGYRKDLYRLSEMFEDRTEIETHHFEKIDNAAAPVFARMNRDVSPTFTANDKEAVARFLLSLRARNPWHLDMFQQIARENSAIDYDRESAAVIFGRASKAAVDQHFVSDMTLRLMVEATTAPEMIERVVRMYWNVWDVSDSAHDLVLSDQPLSGRGDHRIDHSQNSIALPIGPSRYLTCSSTQFYATNSRDMAMIMNREQTSQAAEHIFARSSNHKRLAHKMLRKLGTWRSAAAARLSELSKPKLDQD